MSEAGGCSVSKQGPPCKQKQGPPCKQKQGPASRSRSLLDRPAWYFFVRLHSSTAAVGRCALGHPTGKKCSACEPCLCRQKSRALLYLVDTWYARMRSIPIILIVSIFLGNTKSTVVSVVLELNPSFAILKMQKCRNRSERFHTWVPRRR